jgi:hypothetical protein
VHQWYREPGSTETQRQVECRRILHFDLVGAVAADIQLDSLARFLQRHAETKAHCIKQGFEAS